MLLGSATVLDAVPVPAQGPEGQTPYLRIKKDDGALDWDGDRYSRPTFIDRLRLEGARP